MLKIRSRIALLYSILTIVSILFCIVLFYIFFKFNIYNKPLISSIKAPVDTVTSAKKHDSIDGTTAYSNNDIIIVTGNKGSNNILSEKKTNPKDSISESKENTLGNIVSFTQSNFEKVIMHNIYNRSFIIITIVTLILLLINFLLSKKYATFALTPLINFTRKVKKQESLKTIELIEIPETKDEIYDLTLAYNHALSKIKLSYENLQRLNSYVSHELRNSLAVLRAKVEIGEDTTEITNYIDELNAVISDILAMSTSNLSNNQESVDLALVCAKLIDDYSVIFKNFNFDIPEEGVSLIKGREVWIERCISNLIDNAMKFIDENKDINEINIKVLEDDLNVIVEIYDNGIGIDNLKFDEIFIPYYGSKNRTSTGIGLAYIKHIMDLHEGKVLVESKKGEYSKFSLIFNKHLDIS